MARGFQEVRSELKKNPKKWLVSGAAGFIGSNLVETLLMLGQEVVGLDNFATGHQHNVEDVKNAVGEELSRHYTFIEGDISELADCHQAVAGVDYVLHQAALGSVPRSIEDPLSSNKANVDGFLNMLVAARDAGVKRFVYASSSSVYGDSPDLPKVEEVIGAQLSPYAVTKRVNELYAAVFANAYGMELVGFRYFNVFGPRQDPEGAYAAVIPRWIGLLLENKRCTINGDGETSRDFCYVDNAVQANILGAVVDDQNALNQVYNVAVGERTNLNELYRYIYDGISASGIELSSGEAEYLPFRSGDIRHSLADVSKAEKLLAYQASCKVQEGLEKTLKWYISRK